MEITLAIILSVIALISPSITAWINNRYQLKLEKIKVYETSKKEVLEKFIKSSQAYCVDNTSPNIFSNYVESVLSLYAYFEIKDTKVNELQVIKSTLLNNRAKFNIDMKKLLEEERAAYNSALKIANELHSRRSESALIIEKSVKETLEFLDMPKVVFFASIKEKFSGGKKILNRDGSDVIEFYISANRGAEPQPLSKIASGGEMSRIMLALKSVISDKDGVPTVIYDEIDAGVSGKTARKIGIKMLSLSKNTQLFCVTHSAQIASLGDMHFLISKSDVNGATETSVKPLDKNGRIAELSRILGGIDVTDAQRAAAKDMLEERKDYM